MTLLTAGARGRALDSATRLNSSPAPTDDRVAMRRALASALLVGACSLGALTGCGGTEPPAIPDGAPPCDLPYPGIRVPDIARECCVSTSTERADYVCFTIKSDVHPCSFNDWCCECIDLEEVEPVE